MSVEGGLVWVVPNQFLPKQLFFPERRAEKLMSTFPPKADAEYLNK